MHKKKNFHAIQYLKFLKKLGINMNEKNNTQAGIKVKRLSF